MKDKVLKIGLDRHGVIDSRPEYFRRLAWDCMVRKHEVHILSGHEEEDTRCRLQKMDFYQGEHYTAIFSIVDHNLRIGTPMEFKKTGHLWWMKSSWWMPDEAWNRSKGDYAREIGLDIHFDDSPEYADWFPNTCSFVQVMPKGGMNALRDNGKLMCDVMCRRIPDLRPNRFENTKAFVAQLAEYTPLRQELEILLGSVGSDCHI